MSCRWHIRCVTCAETHHFDEANHMDAEMAALCRHAAALAALVPLLDDMRDRNLDEVSVRISPWREDRWSIDPRWFAKHAGHDLVPIDEYGRLMTQCQEFVTCLCGYNKNCQLDAGHSGNHDQSVRKK